MMNFVRFEFTDGSHMETTKHSDFPIQKMFFFFDNFEKEYRLNMIKIVNRNGKFYIGDKNINNVVVQKQVLHRKDYKCPT